MPKWAGSSRGGATGNSQKTTNATAEVTTSAVRARPYWPGWRHSSQPPAIAGTRKWVPP